MDSRSDNDGDATGLTRKLSGRVLIVEDDADARRAMQSYLQRRGLEIECASNAEEAIQRSSNRPPEVVICDWQLGGRTDGVGAAAEIQQRCGARVIFVTAHRLSHLRRVTGRISVAGYLRKPVTLSVLADVVAAELER
jgi:DNA-binding response OmpR family regulator